MGMRDDDLLIRLEAMLVSLRDQVDHLTERVDTRPGLIARQEPRQPTARPIAEQ